MKAGTRKPLHEGRSGLGIAVPASAVQICIEVACQHNVGITMGRIGSKRIHVPNQIRNRLSVPFPSFCRFLSHPVLCVRDHSPINDYGPH